VKVRDYKDLDVWKKGIEIADLVYEITSTFPPEERYGLSSQMQRAAVRISSNIAEGFMRQHTREYIQFLHISLGSCAEIETQLEIARRREYVDESKRNELAEALNHESGMIVSMAGSLRRRNAAPTSHESRVTRHQR
jgi:four helix bundle protein